jgi:hypothetical protein
VLREGLAMRRIYSIDDGMGKLVYARFALLRASPAGSKEGSYSASLRHD